MWHPRVRRFAPTAVVRHGLELAVLESDQAAFAAEPAIGMHQLLRELESPGTLRVLVFRMVVVPHHQGIRLSNAECVQHMPLVRLRRGPRRR